MQKNPTYQSSALVWVKPMGWHNVALPCIGKLEIGSALVHGQGLG